MGLQHPDDNRGDYLLRLRPRAMARMRRDEDVHAEVAQPPGNGFRTARRAALRRMGMAAAGVAVGTLRARAASVMSLRSAAPQYGAPSWPSGVVALERPEKVPDYLKPVMAEA